MGKAVKAYACFVVRRVGLTRVLPHTRQARVARMISCRQINVIKTPTDHQQGLILITVYAFTRIRVFLFSLKSPELNPPTEKETLVRV